MLFSTCLLTFNSGSSFPAKASNSVVFPELGGPKSSVILQNQSDQFKEKINCSFDQENEERQQERVGLNI